MSLDDSELSPGARILLADTKNDLFLSPASYWEIAIKISSGKYELNEQLDEFIRRELDSNNISILPISPEHAAATISLPWHHRDPFDRLLIAQAVVENLTIISKDRLFDAYPITRAW